MLPQAFYSFHFFTQRSHGRWDHKIPKVDNGRRFFPCCFHQTSTVTYVHALAPRKWLHSSNLGTRDRKANIMAWGWSSILLIFVIPFMLFFSAATLGFVVSTSLAGESRRRMPFTVSCGGGPVQARGRAGCWTKGCGRSEDMGLVYSRLNRRSK